MHFTMAIWPCPPNEKEINTTLSVPGRVRGRRRTERKKKDEEEEEEEERGEEEVREEREEEEREEEEEEEGVRVLEKLLSVSYLTLMVSECGRGGREKLMLCIQN